MSTRVRRREARKPCAEGNPAIPTLFRILRVRVEMRFPKVPCCAQMEPFFAHIQVSPRLAGRADWSPFNTTQNLAISRLAAVKVITMFCQVTRWERLEGSGVHSARRWAIRQSRN